MTHPPDAADGPNAAFLHWLNAWYDGLAPVSLRDEILAAAGSPEHVAILVVDLLVGFCSEGPLASPRVGALGPKAAVFLRAAHEAGIRSILLAADAHPPGSPEFAAFPVHCVAGTREADVIPELTGLPFYSEMVPVSKGSLNVGLEEAFREWQREHPAVRSWIIIGDCTDLCVYHVAMHLRMSANTAGADAAVWVPAELVDTYDLPVPAALEVGALPHPGDLMHRLFLYHLALNGVRVVRDIAP